MHNATRGSKMSDKVITSYHKPASIPSVKAAAGTADGNLAVAKKEYLKAINKLIDLEDQVTAASLAHSEVAESLGRNITVQEKLDTDIEGFYGKMLTREITPEQYIEAELNLAMTLHNIKATTSQKDVLFARFTVLFKQADVQSRVVEKLRKEYTKLAIQRHGVYYPNPKEKKN
jgi:hypothetical protein